MKREMQQILNMVGYDNACQGKIRYPTIDAALKAKARMEKKRGCKFSVYRCMWCRKHHIGKTVEPRKEANG